MFSVQIYALLARRKRPSWTLKGMFLNVEGHILASSTAFSRKEKGAVCEIS